MTVYVCFDIDNEIVIIYSNQKDAIRFIESYPGTHYEDHELEY